MNVDVHFARDLVEFRRRAGINGAAKNDALVGAEQRQDVDEKFSDGRIFRIEKFVDRRADHDHDMLGLADERAIVCDIEQTFGEHLLQNRLGAAFAKRHPAAANGRDARVIDVVDRDAQSGVRQRDRQRQPNVTASTHYTDVVFDCHACAAHDKASATACA